MQSAHHRRRGLLAAGFFCFPLHAAVTGLALLLAAGLPAAAEEPQTPAAAEAGARPNIIVILSDDMGFSDLGCYGGEIQTPRLDALAAGGLRFTQFYNTARCCPTRASLLTGLYPHQAGVGHMTGAAKDASGNPLPGYRGGLRPESLTIAEALRRGGYRTAMAGKWHVCREGRANANNYNWPVQRGFDKFYGTIAGAGSYYDPATLCRQNTFITPENDPEYSPGRYYYTDAITDNAITFVKQLKDESPEKPFFLYVAYTAAHWPLHAPPEVIAKYDGVYDAGYGPIREQRLRRLKELGIVAPESGLSPAPSPGMGAEHPEWEANCMEVYAAMVDRMDEGIGRLVDQLQTMGELDNTLVMYMQDNGGCAEPLGRKEPGDWGNHEKWRAAGGPPMKADELQTSIWPPMRTRDEGKPLLGGTGVMPGPDGTYLSYGKSWANVSNTPFREYKHWVHEGGIATPLVVHWPAAIPNGGGLRTEPSHLIDVMATCLDVAETDYPADWSGKPTTPPQGVSLMPAVSGDGLDRESIYWEHEGNCAVRTGDWKLVRRGIAGPWELYDLSSDRTEQENLAGSEPQRVAAMAADWEAWAEKALVKPWPWRKRK